MKEKHFTPYIISVLLLSFVFLYTFSIIPNQGISNSDEFKHYSTVCVTIEKENGNLESVYCSSNAITNAGLNATRDLLGGAGVGGSFDFIALGNTTAPTSTSTSLAGEYTAGGLTRAQGTYFSQGTNGNWTITKTFTSTANSLLVNTTGLLNASSSGTMFAGNSFTASTLQTNDQVTINWTIWNT